MERSLTRKRKFVIALLLVILALFMFKGTAAFAESGSPAKNDKGAYVFNGHSYYLYVNKGLAWLDAQSYCEHVGGHLVTITSAAENEFIFNNIVSPYQGHALIGLSDAEAEDSWKWVTGEAFSYSNWESGEPNNAGNEDYVLIKYDNGCWNDGHLDREDYWAFVCEWDNSTGGPTEAFTLGIDSNNFVHSSYSENAKAGFVNVKNYKIPDAYFQDLTKGLGKDQRRDMREMMKAKWGGSCYGIAATMALVNNGILSTSDISSKSGTYFGMDFPYKDTKLLDNINYCYLGQYVMSHEVGNGPLLASYMQLNGFYQTLAILHGDSIENYTPSRFFEKAVNAMESASKEGKVLMFAFNNHCVLMTDYWYNKNKQEHVITLYDENTVESDSDGRFTQMVLSKNCDKVSFEVDGDRHSFSDLSAQIHSSVGNMKLIDPSQTPYYGKSSGSKAMQLNSASDFAIIQYPDGYEFTITNKEGKHLNIHEYEEDDGDMEILGVKTIINDGRNIIQLMVPSSDWFCVSRATGVNYDAPYNWEMDSNDEHTIGDYDKKINISIMNGGKYMSLDSSYVDCAYFYADDNSIKIVPADEMFMFESVVQLPGEDDEDTAVTLSGSAYSEVSIKAPKDVTVVGADVNVDSIAADNNGQDIPGADGMVTVTKTEPETSDDEYSDSETEYGKKVKVPKAAIKSIKAGKKKMTVKLKKLKGGVKYQIAYRAGKGKWKIKTVKKTKVVIKTLKARKKYSVRVRALKTVSGSRYYGAWSKIKKIKIK